jgi:hypothetical protein
MVGICYPVSVFAENVEKAREMALGPQGTMFVGSRTVGSSTRLSIGPTITSARVVEAVEQSDEGRAISGPQRAGAGPPA